MALTTPPAGRARATWIGATRRQSRTNGQHSSARHERRLATSTSARTLHGTGSSILGLRSMQQPNGRCSRSRRHWSTSAAGKGREIRANSIHRLWRRNLVRPKLPSTEQRRWPTRRPCFLCVARAARRGRCWGDEGGEGRGVRKRAVTGEAAVSRPSSGRRSGHTTREGGCDFSDRPKARQNSPALW